MHFQCFTQIKATLKTGGEVIKSTLEVVKLQVVSVINDEDLVLGRSDIVGRRKKTPMS